MSGAVLVAAIHDWYCPNCGATDQTREVRPHSRFHSCAKLRGLTAPMLRAGTKAKVELREREDYTGPNPLLPDLTDPSRRRRVRATPRVMSIVTTRDDGQDCVVFAPTALANGGAH